MPRLGTIAMKPWFTLTGTSAIARYPIGARDDIRRVPLGSRPEEICRSPASVTRRTVLMRTLVDSLAKSFGVTQQCEPPRQYSSTFVLGVDPPTIVQVSPIGLSSHPSVRMKRLESRYMGSKFTNHDLKSVPTLSSNVSPMRRFSSILLSNAQDLRDSTLFGDWVQTHGKARHLLPLGAGHSRAFRSLIGEIDEGVGGQQVKQVAGVHSLTRSHYPNVR